MKIKNDFITNSSSSSFVIALKNTLTKKELIKDIRDSVTSYIDGNSDVYLFDFSDELNMSEEEFENLSQEEKVDIFCDIFAERILDEKRYGSIQIEDWEIFAREYGSEDGAGFSYYMYSYFSPKSKKIKYETYT